MAWELSTTLDTDFCLRCLERALRLHGKPEIMNTYQGCQFTSKSWLNCLQIEGIAISMDGKGRWIDNVIVERFWRSIKYEDIYLKSYENPRELAKGVGTYIRRYNASRPHQSLDGQTPDEIYAGGAVESSLNRRQSLPLGKGLAATTGATGLNLTGATDWLKSGTTSCGGVVHRLMNGRKARHYKLYPAFHSQVTHLGAQVTPPHCPILRVSSKTLTKWRRHTNKCVGTERPSLWQKIIESTLKMPLVCFKIESMLMQTSRTTHRKYCSICITNSFPG